MSKDVAFRPAKRVYYIVHSTKKNVVHYGFTEPDQVTTTGQEKILLFDSEKKWKAVLKGDFGIEVDRSGLNGDWGRI